MKEQKIIRYRLSISRYFPAYHPKKGDDTYFVEQIQRGAKIHTIRANVALWEKRMKKVKEGKAVIELYYWTGKPYHSPQQVFEILDKESGCGTQRVDLSCLIDLHLCLIVNENSARRVGELSICLNDGLRLLYFEEWFKKYNLSEPLAIIHFTKFRY